MNAVGTNKEIFQYKKEKSFEERKKLADEELKALPHHIPIVLQRSEHANFGGIDSQRLSMSEDTNEYKLVDLANVTDQQTEDSVIVYAKGNIFQNLFKGNLREFYEANKDEDGVLYLLYDTETSAHHHKYLC